MSVQKPARGTQDLIGETAQSFRWITDTAWKVAQRFGFIEISTPIFEFTEVFKRSLGDTTDIVSKEMYCFNDRNGESLTLRPEGTAGVVRAFLSNGLAQNLPLKLFYSGPMFRYERPQKGRYRQFHQLGVEVLGHDTPKLDVETICLAGQFLEELGLREQVQLELNTLGDQSSRQKYRSALQDYFSNYRSELSPESQERLQKNPLRILDSKSEGDQKIASDAPPLEQFLNDESKKFIDGVKQGLTDIDCKYVWNTHLVRGLDYYCHTVFEFTTNNLGAQNAVLAGGRYDQLVEMMGGKPTPGFGWAAGIERLSMLIGKREELQKKRPIALLPMSEAAHREASRILAELRQNGLVVETTYSGSNLGKLMKKANKWNASATVILGDDELDKKKVTVKGMDSGEQKEVDFSELSDYLLNNFAASTAK